MTTYIMTYDNCNDRLKAAIDWGRQTLFNKLPNVTCWIAGGALRAFFSNTEVKDIDIYFRYQKGHETALKKLQTDLNIKPHYTNHNTVTLGQYDLTKHFYEDPSECINDFDFTVCACAITKDEIYYDSNFFTDLASRTLIVNNSKKPVASLIRIKKYLSYGYTISDNEILKLAKACKEVDFDNLIMPRDTAQINTAALDNFDTFTTTPIGRNLIGRY